MTSRRLGLGKNQLKVIFANRFIDRLLGYLINRKNVDGIYFPSCNSIHTLFMRFPIDVVFFNKSSEVIEIKKNVRPWRVLLPRLSAKSVLEVPTEDDRRFELGQKILWKSES